MRCPLSSGGLAGSGVITGLVRGVMLAKRGVVSEPGSAYVATLVDAGGSMGQWWRHRGGGGWLVIAVVAAVASVGYGGVVAAGTADDDRGEDVLAVVNVGGGTFTERDGGYRLTLTAVPPSAVWFADRPGRAAGTMPIDELLAEFFVGEPPNAAVDVFADPAAGAVVIVELSDPHYDAAQQELSFDAEVLEDHQIRGGGLEDQRQRVTDRVPSEFGAAALFLDDSCTTSQGTAGSLQNITCAQVNAVVNGFAQSDFPESYHFDVDGVRWTVNPGRFGYTFVADAGPDSEPMAFSLVTQI
jgi:hypothetical protein